MTRSMAKRTTLYLDEALLERARRFVPARGISMLVNQLLAERLADLERAALEKEMREGYLAVARERNELNQEWGSLDLEEWPD